MCCGQSSRALVSLPCSGHYSVMTFVCEAGVDLSLLLKGHLRGSPVAIVSGRPQ